MLSLESLIYLHAKSTPDRVALIGAGEGVSYHQVWHRSLCMANSLKSRFDLHKGECVIVTGSGDLNFVYAYIGIHIAGGICVPIDPDTNQTRFNYIKDKTNPKVVLGTLSNVDESVSLQFLELNSDVECTYTEPTENDVADILFTTGTTGTPKGVMLTYGNIVSSIDHINDFIENTADDVELIALPVSHSFGLGRLRCTLAKGGTAYMLGTFANIKRFFKTIEEYHITGFGMVPASWNFIRKMSGDYLKRFSDQLKYIEIGSSFMPVEEKQHLLELLPNTRICMHYGLTEASRSAYMEFHENRDNLLTIGKAAKGVSIQIFDSNGNKLPCGSEGEICVKGKHVCCGYWKYSETSFKRDFYGDYFRTGDCGIKDDNDFIYLRSRLKEIINVGGKKVSPTEVEAVLNQVPGIIESACVSIPDKIMGEVVKAFVVCSMPVADSEIFEFLKTRLEIYKMPAVFERIPEIPKTSSGKIQRLKLK